MTSKDERITVLENSVCSNDERIQNLYSLIIESHEQLRELNKYLRDTKKKEN